MPYDQVVDYIRGANIGIISVEPVTLSYQYCMPNKLFEMSFANIPIISNDLDEIREYLAENRNGEIVDFQDSTALVYVISRLLNGQSAHRMDEARMKHLTAKYSWDTQARKLLEIYSRILAPAEGVASIASPVNASAELERLAS